MPCIWLTRTFAVAGKDLQHDVRTDYIALLPAVGHATTVMAIRINEHDKFTVDAQEAWIFAIMIPDICQVILDLGWGGIAVALHLVVQCPAEASTSCSLEQAGNLAV